MGFYYTRDTLAQKRKSFESFANTAFLYGAHVAEAKCRYVLHLSPPLITRSTKRTAPSPQQPWRLPPHRVRCARSEAESIQHTVPGAGRRL